MDLGGSVTYNGLSLNTVTRAAGGKPSSGYLVERFAPEPPPPTSYLEKRALADGLDAGDVYLGGRSFSLIVTAFGSTDGLFWDKAQDLFAAFSPTIAYDTDTAERGFLAFDFYQPTADVATWPTSAYPSGIPMRYYMRPTFGPVYAVERDRDGGTVGGGRSKPFSIGLVARDPRKYLQTATTTGQFTTANQTAAYRGDYWTHPIINFSLSATGHSAFTLTVGNLAIVLNMSSDASGNFEFDFGKRTFIATGTGLSKMDRVTSVAGYAVIESGTTYKFTNPTGVSTCTMTYREAFA